MAAADGDDRAVPLLRAEAGEAMLAEVRAIKHMMQNARADLETATSPTPGGRDGGVSPSPSNSTADAGPNDSNKSTKGELFRARKESRIQMPLRPSQQGDIDEVKLEGAQGRSVVQFHMNIELAVRSGAGCVLCALPLLIPGTITDSNYAAMVGSAVTYVVFTGYRNLGITTMYAWQGLFGTFIACLQSHIMNALMPGGAGGDNFHPFLSHVAHILFVVVVLWLDLSLSAQMFMLSYHCYFAMELFNPKSTMIFNTGWGIDIEAYTTTTFVCAFVGISAAVISRILPWPLLATQESRKAALTSVGMLTTLMDDIAQYYMKESGSVEIYRSETQVERLRDLVFNMTSDIDGSWWEAMFVDFGRWGAGSRTRGLLRRHVDLMQRMCDNADALYLSVCKEDFTEIHRKCMGNIANSVEYLMETTRDLLIRSTLATNDGHIDEEEREELDIARSAVTKSMKELAKRFDETRKTISPHQVINPSLQSETFFVYALTTYARFAVEYAKELQEKPPSRGSVVQFLLHNVLGVMSIKRMREKEYRSFVLRNTLSVLITFYLGMIFYSYNGTAAGTVSLLLSSYTGSALQKNLGRLQGVVIASIIPHMMANALGNRCWAPVITLQACSIMFWETLTNYVYYASPNYGYIGSLAGGLGGVYLVYPCVNHVSAAAAEGSEATFEMTAFTKVTQTAIAALVLTAVDIVFAPDRASTKATDQLRRALVRTDAAVEATFYERKEDGHVVFVDKVKRRYIVHYHDNVKDPSVFVLEEREPKALQKLLDSAAFLGEEADKELRHYRVPWPRQFFNAMVKYGYNVRANANEIEHALAGSDNVYDDIFKEVRDLQSFDDFRGDLFRGMYKTFSLMEMILLNETGKPRRKQMAKELKDIPFIERATRNNYARMVHDLNEKLSYPAEVAETLEDDEICRISVVLMLLQDTAEQAAVTAKRCVTEA